MDWQDTIVAPASAAGRGARGIVRASGPEVPRLITTCFRTTDATPASSSGPHALAGMFLASSPLGEVPCQVLVWPTRRSYTRQQAAEFHLPGSPPILASAVDALCRAGARLAQPGEFTLRAFLAGRLDLTQAEAVLGVVQARDQRELAVALQQLGGGLAGPLHFLRDHLLDLLAHLEAGLDFVEEDITFLDREALLGDLEKAADEVRRLVERLPRRTPAGHEFRVVLRGLPNSGKSSLLNALSGEHRALVADQAGTTRDYVRTVVDLDGLWISLIDTAGLEDADRSLRRADGLTPAEVEISRRAQRATSEQFEQAHLELFCVDGSRPRTPWEVAELRRESNIPRILVETKRDLAPRQYDPIARPPLVHVPAAAANENESKNENEIEIENENALAATSGPFDDHFPLRVLSTSSLTGEGLAELRAAIRTELGVSSATIGEVVQGTALRCDESLRRAGESLERAHDMARSDLGEELVAAELRLALDELGQVVGAVYTDDVLDRIFSRFCIGK